jgi:hypothetical protein
MSKTPSELAKRICNRHFAANEELTLWQIIDQEVSAEAALRPLGLGYRDGLTPAQSVLIDGLQDRQWHTYGGRRTAMINRLADAGLVQFRYHPRAPGMPERIDARLTPSGEAPGHVAFER